MAEVAREANLTRATLYRHFGDRDHLLEAIRAEALLRAAEAIDSARLDEGPAVDAIRRVVESVVALGGRFRVALAEGADRDPAFQLKRAEVFAPLSQLVRRGQQSGDIRADLPAEWVVLAVIALLTAGVRESPTLPDGSEGADLIVTTLLHGIWSSR